MKVLPMPTTRSTPRKCELCEQDYYTSDVVYPDLCVECGRAYRAVDVEEEDEECPF